MEISAGSENPHKISSKTASEKNCARNNIVMRTSPQTAAIRIVYGKREIAVRTADSTYPRQEFSYKAIPGILLFHHKDKETDNSGPV